MGRMVVYANRRQEDPGSPPSEPIKPCIPNEEIPSGRPLCFIGLYFSE